MTRTALIAAIALLTACTTAPVPPTPAPDAAAPSPTLHPLAAGMLIPQPGDAGTVLASNGRTSIPTWQTPTVPYLDAGAIGAGVGGQLLATTDAGAVAWSVTPGTAGLPLVSNGSGLVPSYQAVGASALSPGSAGQVLQTCSGPGTCWNSVTGDTTINSSGVTSTATLSGTSAITSGSATSFRIYPVSVPRIMALGDSRVAGSNGSYTGLVGGWPSYFVEQMRQWRGDFEMVASQAMLSETSAGSSVPWNEGHPGYTIAYNTSDSGNTSLNGNWTTWTSSAAFGGGPDIVLLEIGTNDIAAGRSAAQMEADYTTLHTSILTTNPNALIVDVCMSPFVAGTTVSSNLSAWNAIQSAFCSWMSGTFVPAHSSTDVYSSCALSLTQGDTLPDGVHPNQQGQSAIGTCLAQQINALLGMPRGPPQLPPSGFRYREPWASEQVITDTTDGLSLASHSGVDPGAGSFTIAFDFYPTSIPSGTNSLVSYGSYGVNNYYGIYAVGNALRVYWENTTATIATTTGVQFSENALTVGKWHRIVVMADATHGVVGLYVNGKLAGLATSVGNCSTDGGSGPYGCWTNTQQTLTIGKDATFGQGCPGYYSRLWAAKAVPGEPGGVAALRAVEADYYLGQSLVPGQATASFTLNGLLSDDVYAPGDPNPSFTNVGSIAAVGAYPGGTPVRPWELEGREKPSYLYDTTGAARVQAMSSGAYVAGITLNGTTPSTTNVSLAIDSSSDTYVHSPGGYLYFGGSSAAAWSQMISGDFYSSSVGAQTLGANGAWGSVFFGSSTTANLGYTEFAAAGGTHNTQDAIVYNSVNSLRINLANYGTTNAQSYTISGAGHGVTLVCDGLGRVITPGSGGTCSFWAYADGGTSTGKVGSTYHCQETITAWYTGSTWVTYNSPIYGSCDCSGGACTPGSSPSNPLLILNGTSSGATFTLTWALYNDACSTPPVVDVVSACHIVDN